MQKFIFTADWHLRASVPICRSEKQDEWLVFMEKVVSDVINIAEKNGADIIIAGDIFHTYKVPSYVLNMLLDKMLCSEIIFYIIPGQHDLWGHNEKELTKYSSYGTLELLAKDKRTNIRLAKDYFAYLPYGGEEVAGKKDSDMLIMHRLIYSDSFLPKDPHSAEEILKRYPYSVIISGDNHRGFVYERDGRKLIVPGCLTVQSSDFKDYKPSVVLYDSSSKETTRHLVYNKAENIIDEHIGDKENDKFSSFIVILKSENKFNLSFEDNVKQALENETNMDVKMKKEIIYYLKKGVDYDSRGI